PLARRASIAVTTSGFTLALFLFEVWRLCDFTPALAQRDQVSRSWLRFRKFAAPVAQRPPALQASRCGSRNAARGAGSWSRPLNAGLRPALLLAAGMPPVDGSAEPRAGGASQVPEQVKATTSGRARFRAPAPGLLLPRRTPRPGSPGIPACPRFPSFEAAAGRDAAKPLGGSWERGGEGPWDRSRRDRPRDARDCRRA